MFTRLHVHTHVYVMFVLHYLSVCRVIVMVGGAGLAQW